jgi:hypothetical protein
MEENPDQFYGRESPLAQRFDIVLFPLGLAYAKRGTDMPWFTRTIREAIDRGDDALADRCIRGLRFVGFHHPEAVFTTLRAAVRNLADPTRAEAVADCLSIIRVLHFNPVDAFLSEVGAADAFQRRVAQRAGVELVHDCINWLGFYNNAVHFSICYPKMREGFAVGALEILATAKNAQAFLDRYSKRTFRMG